MRPFEPGDPGLVGGLWLSGRLGEGPLGVVFLGQQADGTRVAVKLLHAHLTEDPAVWEAYQQTMEKLTGLSIPHTARALSTGLVGARPYLMSEYVEGVPLPDIPEPFSPAELERLAVRTATALATLHAAGIAHGALRPSNVIMSAEGAVLTDFGLTADQAAAMAADLPDWARLLQATAGEQELPPRLLALVEACLSQVPPPAAELLRQLTAPTSDPSVTVTELTAPPAAFGRPTAPEPVAPPVSPTEPTVPAKPQGPPPLLAAAYSTASGDSHPTAPSSSGAFPAIAQPAEPQATGHSSFGSLPVVTPPIETQPPLGATQAEIQTAPSSFGALPGMAQPAEPQAADHSSFGSLPVVAPPVETWPPAMTQLDEPQMAVQSSFGALPVVTQPAGPAGETQVELLVTAFDPPPGDGTGASPGEQTMLDPLPAPAAAWAAETRLEGMPLPAAPPPLAPGGPASDVPPPWAGEGGAEDRGPKRMLLVAAASVTVALLLAGVFAVTRGGGEGGPEPVAAKTGVVPTTTPVPDGLPTQTPTPTPTPSAPLKSQKNAGSPTPTPKSTPTPSASPKKKPKPPKNLLANGGFENGFGNWQPRAVAILGAKAAHSGKHAVQLQAGDGYDAAVEYVVTGLKPNTVYQVTGWVTSNAGATFLGAKDFGPASKYASSASAKWTRLTVTFKTGAGTTARIYCWRNTPGTGACDDISLHRRR